MRGALTGRPEKVPTKYHYRGAEERGEASWPHAHVDELALLYIHIYIYI